MAKNELTTLPADPGDPEDFDASLDALDRGQKAHLVRTARTRLGLSQAEFARRFHVPLGTLRDWEQARAKPRISPWPMSGSSCAIPTWSRRLSHEGGFVAQSPC